MFNILSPITLKVKFLRNKEQHCLLPSVVDDFTCVHSKNALLTHILSTLFSSTSVLFSCTPFGTNMHAVLIIMDFKYPHLKNWLQYPKHYMQEALKYQKPAQLAGTTNYVNYSPTACKLTAQIYPLWDFLKDRTQDWGVAGVKPWFRE